MAEVTAQLVKELRARTGAGIVDCKTALVDCSGDIESAVDYLRKKGISKAGKKADRVAGEGTICIRMSSDNKVASIIELNSETDFVAKNKEFRDLAEVAAGIVFEKGITDVCSLNKFAFGDGTFDDYLRQMVATIGENIVVRRVAYLACGEGEILNSYLHFNGRLGSVVKLRSSVASGLVDCARGVAMQVSTMKPLYISIGCVPKDVVDREREVSLELLKKEGKPESMWEKILPGKMAKFYEDVVLQEQKYILDDKLKVSEFLQKEAGALGGSAEVVDFVRYELGEGIEKKTEDFAAEVAAQMNL